MGQCFNFLSSELLRILEIIDIMLLINYVAFYSFNQLLIIIINNWLIIIIIIIIIIISWACFGYEMIDSQWGV